MNVSEIGLSSGKKLRGSSPPFHPRTLQIHVGFEVLTPVVMKSSIFWDISPCSLLKVNRLLAGDTFL
jgi:hypothetical protein